MSQIVHPIESKYQLRKGKIEMKHIIETELTYIVTDRGQVFTDFKNKHTISIGYAFHSDCEMYEIDAALLEYDDVANEYVFSWTYTNEEGQSDTWQFLIVDTLECAANELHDLADNLL